MDAAKKILVVEDDHAIRNLIHRYLSRQKYQMEAAEDGKSAIALFERFNPDLVILDVNLPDTTGYMLCQEMQNRTEVLVLMLTSLTDKMHVLEGFSRGADDYLTKPFDLEMLQARVEALLKRFDPDRGKGPAKPPLTFGSLLIDSVRREVKLNGDPVLLTALEFDLLYFLARHPGRVWRREELIQEVWKYDYVGDHRVVDVHIGQIRKKIESEVTQPAIIQTVRGVGYKFEAPTESAGR
jgi:DNA-binding response OmpR family regulator